MGSGASTEAAAPSEEELGTAQKSGIVQALRETLDNAQEPVKDEELFGQLKSKYNEALDAVTRKDGAGASGAEASESKGALELDAVEDALKDAESLTQQMEAALGDGGSGGAQLRSPERKESFRQRRLTFARQTVRSRRQVEDFPTTIYAATEMGEVSTVQPPFPGEKLGTYSCHGIEPSWEDDEEVVAKINQDRGCVVCPFNGKPNHALLCVFDGHGEHGDLVSQFVMSQVWRRLEKHPSVLSDPPAALRTVFVEVDRALCDEAARTGIMEPLYSGTTAVVVYVREQHLYIANAGDSRAVLAVRRQGRLVAQDLSRDHNPDAAQEKERIEAAGAFVSPPPEEGLSARVWLDADFTQIGLAMSRSIGDHAVKDYGVIAEPEITEHDISGDDAFLIMATDGVWEFITSQEAVAIVAEHIDAPGEGAVDACRRLIETAAGRWQDNEGDYRDDITAIVVTLPLPFETPDEAGAESDVQEEGDATI
mmetsp:Transcript_5828/g.19580  ORF Transcript_5828/g.19580 Transcript_5828/m.19580 type:complete len:482 (-) Transcript_5828:163-1608(-)|eukprot:CAMPEP_0198442040 /NCGR_PEP_ID=MMETSP1452-20131203/65076_1 /TAXON_ID=1181717 /ORGANISM="Synchroma pusillum, Strain CCMP3072" /LENGTH=481 /DNA_ID=CAMNT_0044162671 /DNA_START=100 /DNA_END=1545 /DNA_ORIENTATION=-